MRLTDIGGHVGEAIGYKLCGPRCAKYGRSFGRKGSRYIKRRLRGLGVKKSRKKKKLRKRRRA